jgi:DNA repair protein RecN (Recombination protein N)
MIKTLYIKNYALIGELNVEFDNGLVILTGETGAGKSIIIDALGLLLGERASSEVVRSGADKAIVEGVFRVAGNRKLQRFLQGNNLEASDDLVVRREITAKGQSRCFINDSPTTAVLQKQAGELLVDLHGQHEHQSLLRVENHIEMLDEFGGLGLMVGEFQASLQDLRDLSRQLTELRRREQQLREKREFYEFQLKEIDAVAPQSGEDDKIASELKVLENAEKLFETTHDLYEKLYEGENSIHDLLVLVRNRLQDLASIDKTLADAAEEGSSAVAIVNELAKFVHGYNARVEFNPGRLEHLRERLGQLAHLKKKYGGSVENVLAHRENIAKEVDLAESFNTVIDKLTGQIGRARESCEAVAQRLSTKRQESARKIDKAIVSELSKLGIKNGKFSTRFSRAEMTDAHTTGGQSIQLFIVVGRQKVALNERGCDTVEFYISTNLGEDVKPLAKVASGGEVSRIMLALKSILAKSDRLPVLIFDEIDVGVSGRIAQAVGLSLKNLSSYHQVIAITHLPQIAGLADEHYMVFKSEDGKRAATSIRKLLPEERVHEVAKLMSGAEVTDAGLVGARELMGLQ